MSSFGDDAPTLIYTKLHRPRLNLDLVSRPHLIQQLNRGIDRKLTLISAQAGAGKSTLLAQWLEQCPLQSAWLSLDDDDNDLIVFVSYLCAAIQTVFPGACERALDLVNAPVTPPPRIITTTLVNELTDLCNSDRSINEDGSGTVGMVLALDDYHAIKDPTIHQLVSELITYLPQCVHLALSTRTDPLLPLARLRAQSEMTELRTYNLHFSTEEARGLLELTAGRKLSRDTVDLIRDRTEGWIVGLRLAALSIRDFEDDENFAVRFETVSTATIVDYLVSEVLSHQSTTYQRFLLKTSILDRFNAELCDAFLLAEGTTPTAPTPGSLIPSQKILKELQADNLFLISLDEEGFWFRYHQLFRDLLQHRLRSQHSPEEIAGFHNRASQWFEQNGFINEALDQAFSAGNLDRAARIVARQRYALMNQARWNRLDRLLRRFPPEFANQQPDLLMLKAWLVYHHAHYSRLPAVLGHLETTLGHTSLPTESIRHLKGEISALKSLLYYYQTNMDRTMAEAEFSIMNTPTELWIVRILARLYLAGTYQMKGDLNRAYTTIYQGAGDEVVQSNALRATMLTTVCSIHWVAADLQGLLDTACQSLELHDYSTPVELKGFAHYHLGCAYYHLDDLAAAEEHFAAVVQEPYLSYGTNFAYSAFGLSLTYQALGRPDEAQEALSSAIAFFLETSNTTMLFAGRAFQAELALIQGQIGVAGQWAAQFDSIPPLTPLVWFYQHHLTLVKIWLAQDTPASRRQVAESLGQLRKYAEITHNTVVLTKVLALQALHSAAENDEPAALAHLENALELAQPGGYIRLFVDHGLPMARLLQTLHGQGVSPDDFNHYVVRILAAFDESTQDQSQFGASGSLKPSPLLVDSLTSRELEVLELLAKRLTNKEIAQELVISPDTVKTHTLAIYAKLNVHGRRQAVEKAGEIGLLSPT